MYIFLTLYQHMTYICVMSSKKPIITYMGGLILGVDTLYRLFCFFKLVSEGLKVYALTTAVLSRNFVGQHCRAGYLRTG